MSSRKSHNNSTGDGKTNVDEVLSQYSAQEIGTEMRETVTDFLLFNDSNAIIVETVKCDRSYNPHISEHQYHQEDPVSMAVAKIHESEDDGTITWTIEDPMIASQECDFNVKSLTDNCDDIPNELTESTDVYDDYFRDGCGCARKCHERFPKFMAFKAHLDALDSDQYCPEHVNHQHLLLLGAMNALMQNHPMTIAKEHRPKERKNVRTVFRFRGQEVCRKFFLFVFGCGEKRIKNVMKQFQTTGIAPKTHESSQTSKSIIKINANIQRRDSVIFIRNYAQQHALQLPGRFIMENGICKDLYLLPSVANMTRKYVYDQYLICCRDLHKDSISFALWVALWDWLCPNIIVPKTKYETCNRCREHQYIISKPEPLHDNRKIRSSERYIQHLQEIQRERDSYKSLIDICKLSLNLSHPSPPVMGENRPNSFNGTMHYTFDWFTTVSLPHFNRLSPIYFLSSYKVALFGIACEPIGKYVLYVIPEFICSRETDTQNISISLIHHFFTKYGIGETFAMCHFGDNSAQMNKNHLILSYFAWRTMSGLHEKCTLSYLPQGHSRCWNDLFMGVIKKRFRNCEIYSTPEFVALINQWTQMKSIIAVPVGDETTGELLIPICDWGQKFVGNINHLIYFNHFDINHQEPGLLHCKRVITDDHVTNRLFNDDMPNDFNELPRSVESFGLSVSRKSYLLQNLTEYVPESHRNYLCPQLTNDEVIEDANTIKYSNFTPIGSVLTHTPHSSPLKRKKKVGAKQPTIASTSVSPGSAKRKRAGPPKCSYCQGIGHRERIFGKVTCPIKKADLLEKKDSNDGTDEDIDKQNGHESDGDGNDNQEKVQVHDQVNANLIENPNQQTEIIAVTGDQITFYQYQ